MNGKCYRTRTTKMTVLPMGDPLYSEQATEIEVDDEGAGEYVVVRQHVCFEDNAKVQAIRLQDDEWPVVRDAIEQMFLCMALETQEDDEIRGAEGRAE